MKAFMVLVAREVRLAWTGGGLWLPIIFYLAVATLAAQFFIDWMFARVKWFTNYSHSGSVSTAPGSTSTR